MHKKCFQNLSVVVIVFLVIRTVAGSLKCGKSPFGIGLVRKSMDRKGIDSVQ